jgi:hypothetical protein
MPGSFLNTLASALLIVSACGGAIAAGMPLAIVPAPLVAASGLVLWYETGQLWEYSIFVAGVLLAALWFTMHHFWFLEVRARAFQLSLTCGTCTFCWTPAAGVLLAARSGSWMCMPGRASPLSRKPASVFLPILWLSGMLRNGTWQPWVYSISLEMADSTMHHL